MLREGAVGSSGWDGVRVEDVDTDPNDDVMDYRITEVVLPNRSLTGEIADEWANLTALTTLNLSDNDLSDIPRSVWERFTNSPDALDLGNFSIDDNKDLDPAPPLSLTALATKTDDGASEVVLSWSAVGWYTLEITGHEYRYSIDGGQNWEPGEGDDGWMMTEVGASGADLPNAKLAAPVTLTATSLPKADTYVFQVRAVKTDDGDTPAETGDDTVTRSKESRIDVVGPQTLTEGDEFTLKVKTGYTGGIQVKGEGQDPDSIEASTSLLAIEISEENDEDGYFKIVFTPKAVGVEFVELEPTADDATSDYTRFMVDIIAESNAPSVADAISDQRIDKQRRLKKVDLTEVFSDPTEQKLMYSAESSKPAIADISEESFGDDNPKELIITLKKRGVATITVRATDTDRGWVEEEFRLTVRDVPPNNAPQLIGNIPDLTLYLDDAGTQVDMAQYFRDQDNEFLRLIPQSSDPRVVTATSVGRNVIFSVTGLGQTRMTIIAQDGAGDTAFGSFTVTVLDPNAAPEAVGTIPPQTLRLEDPGLALRLGSYFTDADNDPLTYMAVSADKGVVTVEVTEAIVTLTAVAEGGSTVTVTATDPGGKSATQEILVTVLPANRPPEVVGQIPDQTLQYNDEPLGLDVTMYFTDPDGDELNYVGEGTDESVAEVRVRSHGVVRVDPLSHGEIEVTVTARDPLGASVSQSFMVTVQGNLPPEAVGVIDDQVLIEGGSALTINVEKYFSDPNGDELAYMGTSSNPDAVQAVVIDGSSELVLRPFAPAEGVTVTVTAMDPEGESAAQLVMVSVAAAAPPPTATPVPTATPEPTAIPEPTATPAPTATFVPTNGDGGFPVGLVIVLLLVLAGVAAAVFIIQRRR